MKHLVRISLSTVCALAVMVTTASASTFVLSFTVDAENFFVQYPGFDGPVSGSISWEATSVLDPITALTGIDLTIYGHSYSLDEVGVDPFVQSVPVTVIGGLVNDPNGLSASGLANDFIMKFDRAEPSIRFFVYGLAGKPGGQWIQRNPSPATYEQPSEVPEPSGLVLMSTALLAGLGTARWRRLRPSRN